MFDRRYVAAMNVALTVGDFLTRAAQVYPDRVALVDEPDTPGSLGRLTYAQLHRRARGMALALERMGVGQGERVAIVSPNAARFLIAFWGVSGFGRVLVPINFRLNADEVRYIVEHSGASVLLVDPELDERAGRRAGQAPHPARRRADAELFAEAPDDAEPERWEPDEHATATINYTSGTTARPKGVQITHRNAWLNAVTFGWHVGVTDRDVYLHTLPMFHCNGWGIPYALTGMGGRHVVLRKVDGEEILRRIDAEGVTLLCGAPAVVATILDAAAARTASAARRCPGATACAWSSPARRRRRRSSSGSASELGWEFIQIYGLTETSPLLTINRAPAEWDGIDLGERSRLLSRAGVPAIGVRIEVDDEGEVLARSNNVFEGYWDQPEETAEAIVDGWFHTGDGGQLDGAVRRHLRPQEGRDHHRRRERVVDRGRGRALPAPGGRRGGRHRRARREVGRDGEGARRAEAGGRGDRAGAHRVLPRPAGPLQVPDVDRVPRRAQPHRHRQAPEVQAPRRPTGKAATAR